MRECGLLRGDNRYELERNDKMDRFDFQKEFVELMDKAISNLPPTEFDRFVKRVEQELEEYKDL